MTEIKPCPDPHLLAELNAEIQSFHHTAYPDIFKPYNKEAVTLFFENTLQQDHVRAYVAWENGRAIGYVLLFLVHFADNPFQYARSYVLLDQLLVLESHRSKGVGRLLLDQAFSFAKTNNIDTVELNHWTRNETARRFFSKNGFVYCNEKMWRRVG